MPKSPQKLNLKEETTFLIIKPDGVKRGLIGEILKRIEQRGLKIIALEMILPSKEEIDKHYPKDKEWVTNLGVNFFKTNERYQLGIKPQKEFGTDNPFELGKKVRQWLIEFMISGPVIKVAIKGVHAIDMVRKIVGPTIPAFAEMGTIRGDYSVDSPALANLDKRALRNLVHASGNQKEAQNELKLWFSKGSIHDYKRAEEDTMF